MSILIKGMDMPKSCEECKFESAQYVNNYCRRAYCSLGADYEHCPLIEIVTCKECEYADEYYHCKYTEWWNGNSDFCSHGIPRKEKR